MNQTSNANSPTNQISYCKKLPVEFFFLSLQDKRANVRDSMKFVLTFFITIHRFLQRRIVHFGFGRRTRVQNHLRRSIFDGRRGRSIGRRTTLGHFYTRHFRANHSGRMETITLSSTLPVQPTNSDKSPRVPSATDATIRED